MNRFSAISVTAFSFLLAAAAAEPAGSPAAKGTLLARAGAKVEQQFWNDFSGVTCTELINQTKFGPNGKAILDKKSLFDYLIIMAWNGDELSVSESRAAQSAKGKEPARPLLTTQGFAALLLILHPNYQSSYAFEQLPPEAVQGRTFERLRFRHVPGARSPSALQLRGRDFPIEWEGMAWIDPSTGMVARLQAGLKAPMKDLGLQLLNSDVRYSLVKLNTSSEALYLPEEAVIEARTAKQHWKNIHRFIRYKMFSVNTNVKVEDPKN